MFPSYENDYEAFEEQCMSRYGAKPRPHWITTEFGGKVKLLLCLLSLDHNWISSNLEATSYSPMECKIRGAVEGYGRTFLAALSHISKGSYKRRSGYYKDLKEEE
ncbi:BnaA09g15470D [Brassica napus]|uniref:BnaA09g15470D protein n=1 Tax=Brassica napus TaxID=3708 RepID=A0A078HWE0_BRANA|nr:BnaA09g15470D [Brassica napus]